MDIIETGFLPSVQCLVSGREFHIQVSRVKSTEYLFITQFQMLVIA